DGDPAVAGARGKGGVDVERHAASLHDGQAREARDARELELPRARLDVEMAGRITDGRLDRRPEAVHDGALDLDAVARDANEPGLHARMLLRRPRREIDVREREPARSVRSARSEVD